MSVEHRHSDGALPLRITRQIDALCDQFEVTLNHGSGVAIEPHLGKVEEPGRELLIKELALLALGHLRDAGAVDPFIDLLGANPGLHQELNCLRHDLQAATTTHINRGAKRGAEACDLVIRCPHCHTTIEMVVDASLADIGCPACGSSFSLVNDAELTRDADTLTTIAHFELIERLGMGEFGTVWKARDRVLDRTVAVKIPRRKQLDAASIEKFMREARAAAQLRHANIVSTHEVGRHEDTLYIVSDYIRGTSLAEVMADHRLGIRDAVAIASKVADALEHAHRSGVVHRDLKPSNILIDGDGEPHLMDFGLAKRMETEITITAEGAILGTPAYMSPEQARGEGSQVDGRSDIYSLGVILFQMLTGELPFRGSLRMLLQKVINDDPPGPRTLEPRVPKDLDTICLKCMEKDPARRYAAAGDLTADLRRFTVGEPIAARRVGPVGRTWRWARRNRAISLLLATTMLTMLIATITSSQLAWRAAQNARRADQQAIAVTNTLYDSLLQEIRLTREVRKQGYGEKVQQLVNQARKLPTSLLDRNELRRQLVLCMGDFAAYAPAVIRPLTGETTSLRLSSDGKKLIAGLNDGRLFVYDVSTGKQLAELEAFDGEVHSIALTTNDNRLVAADGNGEVRTWLRAGARWNAGQTFRAGNKPVLHAALLSPDGKLVACLDGPLIEVWDVAGESKLNPFATEPNWTMRNAAFDVARRRLVGGFENEQADTVGWALWDLDSGERIRATTLPSLGHTYANAIAVAKDGGRLAIGFDESLLVYEMADFQPTSFSGFDATKATAFSPTHPYLAAENIRGWITIWNSVTGRQLATLQHPRPGPSRDNLSFSADGTCLAASNIDSIQVWQLARADEKTVMAGHEGGIPCLAFHPNGRQLVSGGKDDQLRFWNPSTGRLIRSLDLGQAVQALSFAAEGRLLAVGCMGPTNSPHLKLIDVHSAEIVHEEDPGLGHVHSLAWAERPDGSYLAVCGAAGLGLWKVPRDSPWVLDKVLHLKRPWCLATVLNRAGSLLVWAQEECRLQAWDVATASPKPLHAPPMHQGWHGVAFLSDGASIIYISESGVAEIWNVEKDCHVDSLGAPGTFDAPHIALSPDGKWLAALTQPDTVSIWHMPTGRHLFSLRPEVGTVWSLAWDAASTGIAVGRSDGGLAVWQLRKIKEKLAAAGLSWHDGI